jgi:hypothetical protein
MARKTTAIVQFSLRIREGLRRRLEAKAKTRGVSANYEITSRLERSLDEESLLTLSNISSDMAINWARYRDAFHELNKQGDLLKAAEALVEQVKQLPDANIKKAVADVERVVRMIDSEAARLARQMHTLA